MNSSTWSPQRVLAWTWVACLALLLLTAYTPLRFNGRTTHLLVLWMAWLFFAPATSCLAGFTTNPVLRALLRWLPRVEWAGLGLLVALWAVLLPLGGRPMGWRFFFPVADPDYAHADPLLSRGSAEYAYELHLDEDPGAWTKPVRVRFLPVLLVWTTPLPPASLDSTWRLRREAGLFLLAHRYRAPAKEELTRRQDPGRLAGKELPSD